MRPSLRKDFVSFYLEKISELKDVEGLQATCLAKTFEDNVRHPCRFTTIVPCGTLQAVNASNSVSAVTL